MNLGSIYSAELKTGLMVSLVINLATLLREKKPRLSGGWRVNEGCYLDENVPIVANDVVRVDTKQLPRAPQASNQCRLAVVQRLRRITSNDKIVLDDVGLLIAKYRRYLDGKGQPGLGDAFLKYVSDNEFNTAKVTRVRLVKDDTGGFAAFPKDAELDTFDQEDRIFVALAIAAPAGAIVVNAVDSDYSHHKMALARNGVSVEELCPKELKPRS